MAKPPVALPLVAGLAALAGSPPGGCWLPRYGVNLLMTSIDICWTLGKLQHSSQCVLVGTWGRTVASALDGQQVTGDE